MNMAKKLPLWWSTRHEDILSELTEEWTVVRDNPTIVSDLMSLNLVECKVVSIDARKISVWRKK